MFSGSLKEDGEVARIFKEEKCVSLVNVGLRSSFSAHGLRLGHLSVINMNKEDR